jgi:hypothetical protein
MVSLVEGMQVDLEVSGQVEVTGEDIGDGSSRERAMESNGKKLGKTTANSAYVFEMSYEYF